MRFRPLEAERLVLRWLPLHFSRLVSLNSFGKGLPHFRIVTKWGMYCTKVTLCFEPCLQYKGISLSTSMTMPRTLVSGWHTGLVAGFECREGSPPQNSWVLTFVIHILQNLFSRDAFLGSNFVITGKCLYSPFPSGHPENLLLDISGVAGGYLCEGWSSVLRNRSSH